MNTEQVVEMIDAITEGQEFTFRVPVPEVEHKFTLKFTEDEIGIYGAGGFGSAIDDPRTVREIAGALIAWANRKEGSTNTVATRAIIGDVRRTELRHYGEGVGNSTSAEWYTRNVKNMSQETKDRNLRDLRMIEAETHPNDLAVIDLAAAIQILIDAGAK